jgi:hypothetical protein
MPATREQLAQYLGAKHAYEDLVTGHARSGWKPGDPWPEHVRQAEARLDELKAAGGYAGPDGPKCCRKYGHLHEPAFSWPGCPWYELKPAVPELDPARAARRAENLRTFRETVTSRNITGGQS